MSVFFGLPLKQNHFILNPCVDRITFTPNIVFKFFPIESSLHIYADTAHVSLKIVKTTANMLSFTP